MSGNWMNDIKFDAPAVMHRSSCEQHYFIYTFYAANVAKHIGNPPNHYHTSAQ